MMNEHKKHSQGKKRKDKSDCKNAPDQIVTNARPITTMYNFMHASQNTHQTVPKCVASGYKYAFNNFAHEDLFYNKRSWKSVDQSPMSPSLVNAPRQVDSSLSSNYSSEQTHVLRNNYKTKLLNSVVRNQVTIVNADLYFSASEITPCLVHKLYPNDMLLCCEPNAASAAAVAQRCSVFMFSDYRPNIISFDTDDNCTVSDATKILFIPAQKLFNESFQDPDFTDYTCIIFHCDIKRSVETDFLLERFRRCMSIRPDMKLVLVLSMLDDILKYVKYFQINSTVGCVDASSNKLMSVKTVWKKAAYCPDKNYLTEVIDTALAIHILNEPGDVLVFLPTPFDISKLVKLLSDKLKEYQYYDATCISLYEDTIEQSELCYYSEPNSRDFKRKFYLATSWAEVIILPSVRYVIDTGIRRDLHYDQSKASEFVTQIFISRARAKLRKLYAGYFGPGICYRLYSRDDYFKRPLYETPEIMLKNPVDVIIKTFFYKTDDLVFTDFMETLPKDKKERAITALRNANIIHENQLTNLGLLISKLPYSHKYSKLIVIGIQWGYGLESIVLVAFFLLKNTIFMYDENDTELQKRVDATKLQYACHDSDTLTNLSIYFDWLSHTTDNIWCNSKALNFNMLRKVQSLVKSIVSVVTKKLKQDISGVKEDRDWSVLQEMIFECFKENLCVYTGHFRSGYRLCSTECIAFLHPSSSILQMTNLPKFVVFDHLKLTSRQFMLSVTSIPQKLVHSTVEKGSQLLGKTLESTVIDNVGTMLIKHGLLGKKGKKLLDIENQIKEATKCDLLVIDPSEEKGNITVYAPSEHIQEIEAAIRKLLEKILESIRHKEETITFELIKEPFKIPISVTWIKGAVVTGVKVKPEDEDTLPNSKLINGPAIKSSINLTWKRRGCRGAGYAVFNARSFSVARRLCTKTVKVIGNTAFVALDTKHANQLYISRLSEETTNENLEVAVNKALHEQLSCDVKVKTAFVVYKNPFETTEHECEIIRQKLFKACCTLLDVHDIDVIVPKPDNNATVMKAFVNMNSSTLDEKNVTLLNKQLRINDLCIKARPVYHSIIMCSLNVFTVLKDVLDFDLQVLQQKLKAILKCSTTDDVFKYNYEIKRNSTFVCLKLYANSIDILNVLQRKIYKLLEGEIITQKSFPDLPKLFTHGGHLWLKSLEKENNVCIIEDYKTKTLRLYGSLTQCSLTFRKIDQFLRDIENEVVKSVDLSAGTHLRALLKALITEYGVDLQNFIRDFQLRSAEVNIRTSKLILSGSSRNIQKATRKLEILASICSASAEKELISCQELCCTCDMPPLQSSLRLEHCGHLYCTECIKGLIATSEFPVQCCAENCDKDLIIEDIHKGLNYKEDDVNRLLNRSLTDFLFRNKEHLMYCPAPGCSFFFDNREVIQNKWTCKLCQNQICIACNVIFHQGYTCENYQKLKNDPDYSLKAWLDEKKGFRKRCPTCKTAIEKNGGCNHMECTLCRAHFCWLCETAFPKAQLVYDHQPFCSKRYK